MSEHTPITGNLRQAMVQWGWADGREVTITSIQPDIDAEPFLTIHGGRFGELCDAIDAVHANLERENAELKAELDRVLGERMTEPSWGYVDDLDPEMMAEHGWYRALDADNVPWRIGDRDENGDEVTSISVSYVIADGRLPRRPNIHRHYQPPTVEDVLREMLDAWGELPSNATNEAIVAEYAKRLKLAEGEDA
jgi:hypothetical protein